MRSCLFCLLLTGIFTPSMSYPQEAKKRTTKVDDFGDPLPEGAKARLGTTRFHLLGYATDLKVSPDGSRYGYRDPQYRFLQIDTQSGKQIGLPMNSSFYWWEFSKDCKRVIHNAEKGEIGIYSLDTSKVETFKVVTELSHPNSHRPRPLRLSEEDRYILFEVTDTNPEHLQLYDLQEKKKVCLLKPNVEGSAHSVFCNANKWILTAGPVNNRGEYPSRYRIQIWNYEGKELHQLVVPGWPWLYLFSPDGKKLATLDEKKIDIYDTATWKKEYSFKQIDYLKVLKWSPDSKTLVASGVPGNIIQWDIETGKEVLRRKTDIEEIIGFTYQDNKNLTAFGIDSKTFISLDVVTRKILSTHFGHRASVTHLQFSPDDSVLYSSGEDGQLISWQMKNSQPETIWKRLPGRLPDATIFTRSSRMMKVGAFSPDGKHMVAIQNDSVTDPGLYQLPSAKLIRKISHPEKSKIEPTKMGFSSNSKRYFVFGGPIEYWPKPTIEVFDAEDPNKQITIKPPRDGILNTELSPDGSHLAANLQSNTDPSHLLATYLWDLKEPEKASLIPSTGQSQIMNFLDDRYLLIRGERIMVRMDLPNRSHPLGPKTGNEIPLGTNDCRLIGDLYDLQTKRMVTLIPMELPLWSRIYPAKITPDGRGILVSLFPQHSTHPIPDHRLVWIEIASGKIRKEFIGHDALVLATAISHDEKTLATASADGTILLWDWHDRIMEDVLLTPEQLRLHWERLNEIDAKLAYQSIRTLSADPKRGIPFLKENLKPYQAPSSEQIKKWIKQLDDLNFREREQATRELIQIGWVTKPFIDEARKGNLSEEQETRLRKILTQIKPPQGLEAELRTLRAIEILERIGSREAQEVLKKLAGGDDHITTHQAKQALVRLK